MNTKQAVPHRGQWDYQNDGFCDRVHHPVPHQKHLPCLQPFLEITIQLRGLAPLTADWASGNGRAAEEYESECRLACVNPRRVASPQIRGGNGGLFHPCHVTLSHVFNRGRVTCSSYPVRRREPNPEKKTTNQTAVKMLACSSRGFLREAQGRDAHKYILRTQQNTAHPTGLWF